MSLRYLLDTNICIYIAKQKPKEVLEKFETLEVGMVGMSTITYGELLFGAQKSQYATKALTNLHQLINFIPAIPLSLKVAEHYGNIRCQLESKGQLIGNNDLWIASHCLELGVILVTNNEREFSKVPGLHVENWVNDA